MGKTWCGCPPGAADADRASVRLKRAIAAPIPGARQTSRLRESFLAPKPTAYRALTGRNIYFAHDVRPRPFRKYAGPGDEHAKSGLRGSVLGLAICKGLVEAHGGCIRAESAGPRRPVHVHAAGGRGPRRGWPPRCPRAPGRRDQRTDARPGGGRRPGDAALRPRRAGRRGLHVPLSTGDPADVPALLRTKRPALVLLDLMLPGIDGVELMEAVHEPADFPVLFISAYGRDETIARALEAGGADYIAYIVKPFSPTELTARVRSVLRRHAGAEPFVRGDLAIDYERRLVTVAGRPVRLTPKEYELLRLFSQRGAGLLDPRVADPPAVERAGRGRRGPGAHLRQAVAAPARRRSGPTDLGPQRARRRLPRAGGGRVTEVPRSRGRYECDRHNGMPRENVRALTGPSDPNGCR